MNMLSVIKIWTLMWYYTNIDDYIIFIYLLAVFTSQQNAKRVYDKSIVHQKQHSNGVVFLCKNVCIICGWCFSL